MRALTMIAPNEVNDPPPSPSSNKNRKLEEEANMSCSTWRALDEDRISNLPAPIIHQILSYLPAIDADRVGVLSKTWRGFWESFPVLDLSQTRFQSALHPSLPDSEKQDLFITHLNNSIGRLDRLDGSITIDKFRLEACFRGHKSDSEIDKAIEIALKHNIHHLDLNFNFILNNQSCNLPPSLYRSKSITSMKLNGFEFGLQELLSACPSTQELELHCCQLQSTEEYRRISSTRLKRLELHGCEGIEGFELHACNLRSFLYSGFGSNQHIGFTLIDCMSLENLCVKYAKVEEGWLEGHVSKFGNLQSLVLDRVKGLKRLRIHMEKFKNLKLIQCADVVEMDINSPTLCSFQYEGEIVPLEPFHSWSRLLYARLTLDRNKEDRWWFFKLRKLLQNFDHCKDLNLVCKSYKDLIFPLEEKCEILPNRYVDLASPLKNVKILRIECPQCVTINYTELIESLFWLSPHLETLFVSSRDEKSCITFQYKTEEEDEDSFCCLKYPKECWQHYLKKVTMKNCEASLTCGDKTSLLKYLRDNAKILETIEVNSKTIKAIQGNYYN